MTNKKWTDSDVWTKVEGKFYNLVHIEPKWNFSFT